MTYPLFKLTCHLAYSCTYAWVCYVVLPAFAESTFQIRLLPFSWVGYYVCVLIGLLTSVGWFWDMRPPAKDTP